MNDANFMTQIQLAETASAAGIAIIGERVFSLFCSATREHDDWTLVAKAFDLFQLVIERPAIRSHVLTPVQTTQHVTMDDLDDDMSAFEQSKRHLNVTRSQASIAHATASLLTIAFQMTSFRFWMDAQTASPTSSVPLFETLQVVMRACLSGSKLAISFLRDADGATSSDAAPWLLRIVSAALMDDHLRPRIVSLSVAKKPLGALCHVLSVSYFDAHNSRWKAYAYVLELAPPS